MSISNLPFLRKSVPYPEAACKLVALSSWISGREAPFSVSFMLFLLYSTDFNPREFQNIAISLGWVRTNDTVKRKKRLKEAIRAGKRKRLIMVRNQLIIVSKSNFQHFDSRFFSSLNMNYKRAIILWSVKHLWFLSGHPHTVQFLRNRKFVTSSWPNLKWLISNVIRELGSELIANYSIFAGSKQLGKDLLTFSNSDSLAV